jgi:hypothetical protein
MFDEKTRGQKSRETVSLSGAKSNNKQKVFIDVPLLYQ